MLRFLRTPTQESIQESPGDGDDETITFYPPANNSTARSRDNDDDQIANPCPRNRSRAEPPDEPQRCCECTRFAKCSRRANTTCTCAKAGRECTNCIPGCRCCNSPPSTSNETREEDAIVIPALPPLIPPQSTRRSPCRSNGATTHPAPAIPASEDAPPPRSEASSESEGESSAVPWSRLLLFPLPRMRK